MRTRILVLICAAMFMAGCGPNYNHGDKFYVANCDKGYCVMLNVPDGSNTTIAVPMRWKKPPRWLRS